MDDEMETLLAKHGWEVECSSPLEIRDNQGFDGFASGSAAWMIYRYVQLLETQEQLT